MKLVQKTEKLLDIPQGSLTGEARVEIDGNHLLTVDGNCEILEYEDTGVRLRTISGELRIIGTGLTLECLHQTGICLSGTLAQIDFI